MLTLTYWYEDIDNDESNAFFQGVIEERIRDLTRSHTEKNPEFTADSDQLLTHAIQEIISEAFLEANDNHSDMRCIYRAIKDSFFQVLSKPFESINIDENDKAVQEALLSMFVKDSAYMMMKHVYKQLYQKDLEIPPEIEERIDKRTKNLKKTGKIGIDPEGKNVF